MYSFASMSIQYKNLTPLNCCKSNIVTKNIKKRTRSSEYSSMYKNITKLMTPSTMKSMLFHRDECFMLGPFTTTNALCTQLIPSKGNHKPSVELAAAGYMKSEIESLFVLLQASFKKQASYYYQNPKLLRYLDSEMKEHKCDIHEIISLYM
mmetsp:Transcript_10070/g.15088  ORF Transcript_10070/g.15088 Transcript_10070/m.15088 type:complete len:151 (-) Transcript_10070:24-476(-)